jgi:hypothetical protein
MLKKLSPQNHAGYETWKNMALPDKPQMTV